MNTQTANDNNRTVRPTTTEAAKRIRAELGEVFPFVRFRVRSKKYAGGSSIDVSWRDGPTTAAVNAIVGKYQDGDFDGMTDSYTFNNQRIGGARYVHTSREVSDEVRDAAVVALRAYYRAENEFDFERVLNSALSRADLSQGFTAFECREGQISLKVAP